MALEDATRRSHARANSVPQPKHAPGGNNVRVISRWWCVQMTWCCILKWGGNRVG
jgi:hypothetical protein